MGASLAVRWLRLCASTAGGVDSILGQETKIPKYWIYTKMHKTDGLLPASSTSFGKQLLFRSIFSFPYERLFEAGLFRSVFFFHSETVGFANIIYY